VQSARSQRSDFDLRREQLRRRRRRRPASRPAPSARRRPHRAASARRLPPRWKVGARELRPFYRRSFATFLPPATLQKSKQGFGMPVGPWLAGHPGLREFAVEQLIWLEGLGLLRRGFRDELMGRQVAEHPAYYGSLVWVLMTLGLWLRQTRVTLVS
jgi:hypothetical protein